MRRHSERVLFCGEGNSSADAEVVDDIAVLECSGGGGMVLGGCVWW